MRPRAIVRQEGVTAPASGSRGLLTVFVITLGLWLAWQVVREALILRLPGQVAVTLAPASPVALRRAAEAAYGAGQWEVAGQLSRQSLARSPFDVKALRVAGLVEAQ